MSFADHHDFSEDLFRDTRMTFGEHLEDLRKHLLRAIAGFAVALLISFIPGWTVLQFISAPVEAEINRFYERRTREVAEGLKEGDARLQKLNELKEQTFQVNVADLARAVGVAVPGGDAAREWADVRMRFPPINLAVDLAEGQRLVYKRPGLSTLGPMEAFMAYVKVCIACGLVLGSPWIFYQIWSFVAAGLYPHEKRLVNVYLPFSVVLFIAGALLCQFMVIPKALEALLWFNNWLNLEPELRFNEWLSFAILLPVLFGASFQLPLVMVFLDRLGIMDVQGYVKKWRIAFFLIHLFAAVVTPVDIFSMESLALTMCGLYGLGILLCWLNPHPRVETEVAEGEEMVEV